MAVKAAQLHESAMVALHEATQTPENWMELLRSVAPFYKYSFENALLISSQRPDAVACATMQQWNRHNLWIRKGSKAIHAIDPNNPYELTTEESHVIDQLTDSFRYSEKLQKHTRFLYSKGGLYKVHNGNLLFHGCIPMTQDGKLLSFTIGGRERSGREFLDYADQTARKAYYAQRGTPEREFGMDFLWWLWAGRNSPIFGRDRMTTFERRFIADESTWAEPKNAYYSFYHDPQVCDMLLKEFGLAGEHCHIVNGHVPVKAKKGESPIKGGGKLIVIDGGFSKAYQPTSGIAGYTLTFGSRYLRIVAHQPFAGKQHAIHANADIDNDSQIIERMETRLKVADTDEGVSLQARVTELMDLLDAYRTGAVTENHNE